MVLDTSKALDLQHKAIQLAESAIADIESLSVWEVFDDISEGDHSEIMRLLKEARVSL